MVQWVFISLNVEYVMSESLTLDADLEDGESVGVEVYPSGEFWEDVQISSTPETVLFTPVSDRISLVELEVMVESLKIEINLSSVGVLWVNGKVGGQNTSPLRASNILVQEVNVILERGCVGFEISQSLNISLEFSERLVVSMIEWGSIKIDDSSNSRVIIASSSQSQLSSESVSS